MRPVALLLVALLTAACTDGAPESVASLDSAAASMQESPARIGTVGQVQAVVELDGEAGELPEGIAMDKRGELYVTLAPLGQVVRVDGDGSSAVFATLDDELSEGVPGALGLATDPRGGVYAALTSFNPETHGVYRIDRDGGAVRLAGSDQLVFPNGLALDRRGNLYVTDSALGAVWRITGTGAAEPWVQDEVLEGTGAFGLGVPIGANGIAVERGSVFVTNSEKGLVVRIPVEGDGTAGGPEVIAGDPAAVGVPELFGLDGLELDVHGRLYSTLNIQNRVVRIDPATGDVTELAAEGLDFPAALAFGTTGGRQKTVFITNFALVDVPGAVDPPGPGIVSLEVGVPGRPLP